jgi:hypothetical protein
MERRHDAADHVLCVVSDEYLDDLKAPFSALERRAAQWQAASKRPRFALFAVVKPCKLPTLADHIRRCELFGIPEDAARTRFRDYLTAPAPPGAFPGPVFAVSNIPIRVPTHFMGRDDDLAHIAAALAQHAGRVAITALHGLRGVGKTTLAAAYAERRRGDYRATWWIRAQAETSMRADLVGLGIRLGWVRADDKEEPALAAVMERLRPVAVGLGIADEIIRHPQCPRCGSPKWRRPIVGIMMVDGAERKRVARVLSHSSPAHTYLRFPPPDLPQHDAGGDGYQGRFAPPPAVACGHPGQPSPPASAEGSDRDGETAFNRTEKLPKGSVGPGGCLC